MQTLVFVKDEFIEQTNETTKNTRQKDQFTVNIQIMNIYAVKIYLLYIALYYKAINFSLIEDTWRQKQRHIIGKNL